MDWELAIERNRAALLRILAALFAQVGLDPHPEGPESGQALWLAPKAEGEPRRTLPRRLHAQVHRILRAAESAIRRLIVMAARDVTVTLQPAVKRPDFTGLRQGKRQGPGDVSRCRDLDEGETDAPARIPAFPLLDPLKRFPLHPPRRGPGSCPRIWALGMAAPAPIPQKPVLLPDDAVDAAGLYRRLLSSRRALDDLPAQARRLARWRERRKLRTKPGRFLPLRIVGGPPGRRKRPVHAVDDILKECDALAWDVLDPPDTS